MPGDLVNLLQPDQVAPCGDQPDLFRSAKLYDHHDARQLCLSCPIKLRCREIGDSDPGAHGTYGGVLYSRGQLLVEVKATP